MKFYTSVDAGYKNLMVCGYSDGKRFAKEIEFKPELYFSNPEGTYKGIDGKSLIRHEFDDISAYRKYLKENRGVVKMYGEIEPEFQAISKWFPNDIKYDNNLIKKVYFDIEVNTLKQHETYSGFPYATVAPIPICAISLFYPEHNEMLVFGLKYYQPRKDFDFKVSFTRFETEREMLEHLGIILTSNRYRPDILYGWNSTSFDIPYIVNRCYKLGGDKLKDSLSIFKKVNTITEKKRKFGREETVNSYHICGFRHIDMMDSYIKFSGRSTLQSYKLDAIAKEEKLGGKLDISSSSSLHDLYFDDYYKYIDYNIQDVHLLYLIDKKCNLSTRMVASAYTMRSNYENALRTTKSWDNRIYNAVRKKGLVIPPKEEKVKVEYAGGYVRDIKRGKHKWVMTLDFQSLYPAIMRMFNMSPETILSRPEEGCITTPTGVCFSNKVMGIIAELVEETFNERLDHKKNAKLHKDDPVLYEMYDVAQYVCKIMINSIYGAMGASTFRYYDSRIAETVTLTGQHLIKLVADKLNEVMVSLVGEGDYIVMGDTDSVAMSFDKFVTKNYSGLSDTSVAEKLVEQWNSVLSPAIVSLLEEFYEKHNVYKKTLKLQLESVAKTGIYIVKKHYIGHVVYDDGDYYTDKVKMKVKGVSGVKSSTDLMFRDILEKFYEVCLLGTNNDVIDLVRQAEREFIARCFDFYGKPVKVNNMVKYQDVSNIYLKGTPSATRGCLVYNHLLEKYNLTNKYDILKDGDFAHSLKLKRPLYGANAICVPNKTIPPEFELGSNLDFNAMFVADFKTPVEDILSVIGWSLTPKNKGVKLKF